MVISRMRIPWSHHQRKHHTDIQSMEYLPMQYLSELGCEGGKSFQYSEESEICSLCSRPVSK